MLLSSLREPSVDPRFFVLWDNDQPYDKQYERLMDSVGRCRPYDNVALQSHIRDAQERMRSSEEAEAILQAVRGEEAERRERGWEQVVLTGAAEEAGR